VPFLGIIPPVAKLCAITGAIQWALHRGLAFPHFYLGRMNYVVPVYLRDREISPACGAADLEEQSRLINHMNAGTMSK
jgi:hypothetical protein